MKSTELNNPIDTTPYQRALISAVVNSNGAYYDDIANTITSEMFSSEVLRSVWKGLGKLRQEGKEISIMVLPTLTDDRNEISAIMGAQLSFQDYHTAMALLEIGYLKRKAFDIGYMLMSTSATATSTEDDIITLASKLTDSEAIRKTDARIVSDVVMTLSDELQQNIDDAKSGIKPRVTTGFGQLDFLTYGGFYKGNLVIMAARPGHGKTAVMLQMAKAAAMSGKHVLIYNLEMSNEELVQRYLTSTNIISTADMASGRFSWDDFNRAAATFDSLPITMIDTYRSIEEIFLTIEKEHRKGRCDVCYIDYLGLMPFMASRGLSKNDAIGEVTKRLKQLAKRLRIPIVLLSQLSRASVKDRRSPELYDLRDSGNIEQDADIVIMLERTGDNSLTMHIRKHRNGRLESMDFKSDEHYTYFYPANPEDRKNDNNKDLDGNTIEDTPF